MKASRLRSARLSFLIGALTALVVGGNARAEGIQPNHVKGLANATVASMRLSPDVAAQMRRATRADMKLYMRAAQAFPAFCKDWERKLHDREINNLQNLTFHFKDGWQTGTYISYSNVKSCNCKTADGVPIGELTYQETEYYLAGHTIDEARHAKPKPVSVTNTTEIFRWDKTKWDY